ncbi:MAG: PilZ domain-containing protein [Phycisphaerales bacterium]|nr:MAG: PilZ domain-containing protein [Phycisphaerales bacterium]
MSPTTLSRDIATRTLDTGASDRVLIEAVRANSPVHLCADPDHSGEVVSGTVLADDGGVLTVDVARLDTLARSILSASLLYASLDVGNDRYLFETRRVSALTGSDKDELRLTRPSTVAVTERRRSRRRRFRKPTEVLLRATDPDTQWQCKADMLNVSLDGIACRIDSAEVDYLAVGRASCVVFQLGATAELFELSAQVVTRTEAGTPGHAVIGMEFIDDGNLQAARDRLRGVLDTPN